MADVTHDPLTDWCACEPDGPDRCEYRMLADTVIESLDVRDGDEAEVALCMTAVERAAAVVKAQPHAALLPAEDMALTVARAQVVRGDNPPVNITTLLVVALDRLTGREDWTAGA